MRKTLRRSCGACAKAKHSCDLRTPKCSRCVKRNCSCDYANEPLTSMNAPLGALSNVSQPNQASSGSLVPSRNGGSMSTDPSDMSMFFEAHLLDPFESYPSTNLPRLRVQSLMQHFLSKIAFHYYPLDLDPSSNPFINSWWPLALKDPALFHVTLQTASWDDELHARKGFAHSELLMKDSVSLLRLKVQDQSLAFQDATMNAVVTLAAIEHGKGNLQVSKMHIDGVKRMVAVRGGLSIVKQTSPLTARMVPWVSLLVTGSPQFETQDDFGQGDGICVLQQWQCPTSIENDESLLDFGGLVYDAVLGDILTRLRSILHNPVTLSATDLHDLSCFTLHRLLSLPPPTSADSRAFSTSECMRYAVSAYMFIIHGPIYYSHIHVLSTLMIQIKFHASPMLLLRVFEDSLMLWILSVGAVASIDTNENHWFCNEAGMIAETLGIRSWDEIEMHLSRVLWLGTRSPILFQQTWEDILASTSALDSFVVSEGHKYKPNLPTTAT